MARIAKRRGTKREAWTEPGCAERQARLQQAHKKQTESVHCVCLDDHYTKFMSVFISEVTLSYNNTDTPTENDSSNMNKTCPEFRPHQSLRLFK